jgi:quinol monooxygenase YgiN
VVIVAGSFEVEPEQREEFLASRLEGIRSSRAEAGCLEYSFMPDPIEPGRVVLYERWADQAALDAHRDGMQQGPPPAPGGVTPTSATITVFDVAGERSLS